MKPLWCACLLAAGMFLFACAREARSQAGAPVLYPAANLAQDSYRPPPGWKLSWSDEFDGENLDANMWTRQVAKAGRFNDEWQRYTASVDNAYLEGGCLVIKAIHEGGGHGPDRYTSARLHTDPARGWRFGRIAARIQLPYGRGVWPAFWMLGTNIDEVGGDTPWPRSGEIDILEMYGSKDDGAVEVNMHYADRDGRPASMGAVATALPAGRFADRFHVFELEWGPASLKWFVDGQRVASTSIAGSEFSAFRREFFILLNLAVGGRSAGRPDETTRFPQYMYVDWVRVYQPAENHDAGSHGANGPPEQPH